MNRREFLSAAAASTAAVACGADEKTVDGGYAEVSWADRISKDTPVLPPGAGSVARFDRLCIGCGLCTAVCPSDCLRPSERPSRLGKPELDFRHGYCRPSCVKCASSCPAKAIAPITARDKRDIHIGRAVWRKDLCVRATEGDECHACEKHCPVKAVRIVAGFPVIDTDLCTGCGACEHYCPARPVTAIRVEGLAEHRVVRPMRETDLIAEMATLIKGGDSAVIARKGVIVERFHGRGLKPLEDAVAADPKVFTGAVCADKVVGLLAAKIYCRGGAVAVYGQVMSEPAKRELEKSAIRVHYGELVPLLECERSDTQRIAP